MDTFLQLLLVGLYSVAEPVRFIGYAVAGAVAKRRRHALGLGALWAVLVIVGGMAFGPGFHVEPVRMGIQVAAGALVALAVCLIARALRR